MIITKQTHVVFLCGRMISIAMQLIANSIAKKLERHPFKSSNIDTIYSSWDKKHLIESLHCWWCFMIFPMKVHDIWVCLKIGYVQIYRLIIIFPIKIAMGSTHHFQTNPVAECSTPTARNIETNWVFAQDRCKRDINPLFHPYIRPMQIYEKSSSLSGIDGLVGGFNHLEKY